MKSFFFLCTKTLFKKKKIQAVLEFIGIFWVRKMTLLKAPKICTCVTAAVTPEDTDAFYLPPILKDESEREVTVETTTKTMWI